MTNEVDLHLGRRLWERRRVLGLTQTQVADAIGVAFQQIQKYECGGSRLSAARLWSVANALGVEVSYFFNGLSDRSETAEANGLAIAKQDSASHELNYVFGTEARPDPRAEPSRRV